MGRKLYEIRKRFEVEMTFSVEAVSEDRAWNIASLACYTDERGDLGESFIDKSVRVTEENVESVSESWADVDGEDEP